MSTLKVLLLGTPRIELDGTPVTIRRRKAFALLIYLAVTQEPHTRETLATLFWSDYDERRARAYLRRAIAAINEALGKGWLLADPEQVAFEPSANLWLDVDHFRQLLAECQTDGYPSDDFRADSLVPLREAVDLYRGDFMSGFPLPDCPDFDNWQFYEREVLRRGSQEALEKLVHIHSKQAEYAQAIPLAQRWLALDPLQEAAHRHLMQLYTWTDQQAIALRQYQECVRLLKAELGVPPEEGTTELFEAIKARRLLPPKEMTNKDRIPTLPDPQSPQNPHTQSRRSANLPSQPTPFIGRDQAPPSR
ncbi:bacterial transcriptional activator domain-containing protein [Chloroflexi bacterium TSY]|nr:bacterial transcriptional activator domain-containing protein [Chloroflexi bacterium TSY]